eukprot:15269789-Alexandrium_andersonii.AAC.1
MDQKDLPRGHAALVEEHDVRVDELRGAQRPRHVAASGHEVCCDEAACAARQVLGEGVRALVRQLVDGSPLPRSR